MWLRRFIDWMNDNVALGVSALICLLLVPLIAYMWVTG